MKILCLSVLCLFLSIQAYSQYSIQGTIKDTKNAGIPFANVLLCNPRDSSLIKGTITDDQGKYLLANVNKGNYIVQSYMVGYNKTYTGVVNFNDQKEIVLDPIILSEDVRELKEVVIKADKPLYEIDRGKMIINVTSSITSSGQSAIDVLEKSPGVNVNRQNSSISVGGKNGVIVMINGKRSRMPMNAVFQMLEGLNAGDIEKIEIMTVPPANYDAEGDAGFINIVMKKAIDAGTNGSFMANLGYGSGLRAGSSLSLNHHGRRFSINGNYSYSMAHMLQPFNMYRNTTNDFESVFSSTENNRDAQRMAHNYNLGIDYYIGKNTIVSALVGGYYNTFSMTSNTNAFFDYSISPDTLINTETEETNYWQHFMGNIGIHQSFDKGQILSADLDYLTYQNSDPTHYDYMYYGPDNALQKQVENGISKDTPINIWVAKIDYSFNIGPSVRLESGLKGTFSGLENDIVFKENDAGNWKVVPDFSSYADLSEDIYAVYSALDIKLDEKTTANAGLRYEYTNTFLSSRDQTGLVDRKYGNLFPTFFISRKINDNNSIQFSYGRRISRPTYNNLAPFVIFVDPYTYFTGNPDILPTFSNNLKGDYSYKNLIFSLQYSHDKNVILPYQFRIDPDTNIMSIITNNIDRRETFSLNLSLPFQPTDWWEIQNNLTGNLQMISTVLGDSLYNRSQNAYRLNTTNTFKLPGKFTIEVSAFYMSPIINGYYNWLGRGFVNFGIQKEIGNNATLRFACNDIFETSQWRWKSDNNGTLNFYGNIRFDKRIFTLTYSQKFGRKNIKGLRKRSNGAEEQLQRVTN